MDELILTEETRIKLNADFEKMNADFDRIEAGIEGMDSLKPSDFPVKHIFTPGLYIRVLFLPAGSLLTSNIHATEHPFTISMGECTVWCPHNGTQLLRAPHTGITLPGTRRIIFCHTDVEWSTYHANPTDCQDHEKIMREILVQRVNPMLEPKEESHELVT